MGGRKNNGMAASQTELPYCSDKGNRKGGGALAGVAQEAQTHLPLQLEQHRPQQSEQDSRASTPASHPAIRGHLRTLGA